MPDRRGDVTVAGGQGFYGDTPTAVDALLAEGVDYLCLEALAELTLAILQKDRQRDEARGYTRDLPAYLARALPFVADGRTKVITNAGGINPTAAAHAAIETARAAGRDRHHDRDRRRRRRARPARRAARRARPGARAPRHRRAVRRVPGAAAVRVGVPRRAPDRRRARAGRRHRDHRPRRRRVAVPRAARARARLGVGRLGPARGRHPRRPPARVLGPEPRRQLLRRLVGAPASVGPAVPDRDRRRRRHRGDLEAHGLGRPGQSTDTLRHQLLYEVHDPARYLSPDVVADFTSAHFEDLPDDRVRITGVRGTPATDTYKLLLASHAGWAGEARVAFSWPDAYEKAKATAAILAQARRDGRARRSTSGSSSTGASTRSAARPCRRPTHEPPECVLRVAWRCADQRTAGLVGRELVPLTLSAPPAGMTGAGRGGGGGATELLVDLADARRQGARRRRGARRARGGAVTWRASRCASCAATAPATRATSRTSRSSPTTTRRTR